MLSPARTFLGCGNIRWGAKLILWLNLAVSVYLLSMCIANLVFRLPVYGYATSETTQIFEAAWNLAGIPLTCFGLYGVYYRIVPLVRLIYYYLLACFLIDLHFLVNLFFIKDACAQLDMAIAERGKAFACGVARSLSRTVGVILTLAMAYSVYIVWSYAKDLAEGGTAEYIGKLMKWDHLINDEDGQAEFQQLRNRSIRRQGINLLAGTGMSRDIPEFEGSMTSGPDQWEYNEEEGYGTTEADRQAMTI
mmetsp:Transcript_139711/g.243262  ORF Transcript_139711/g.243262 Transcript_139711/m.243262 type:complete len:249 (-) Transcript_139711:57-803(-)